MLSIHSQTLVPESKPSTRMNSISGTGPVGLVSTVAILWIFYAGVHPIRWLLAAGIVLGVAGTLILRFTSRA